MRAFPALTMNSRARMTVIRTLRLVLLAALIALSSSHLAHAESSEFSSILELDPAVALNGFAILAAAIVVLFEVFRSRA